MTDLLRYTKQIANRIKYYDQVVNIADKGHLFNPFYKQPDILVIWTENVKQIRQ